ncbi:hypothetical protein Tco_0499855 [Tanacetum coccineum]
MSMMGQMSFFLGLQVSQNPRGIFINQSKYAQEILKKFGFDSCTPIDTPMAERPNLDEDKGGKLIDPTRFRGMVGSLMYLSASRPDIVFAVCMCARYQAKPTEMHLTAIKRIFRYLKRNHSHGTVLVIQKAENTAISTTEAEYIALSGCCAQILWMRSQLETMDLRSTKFRCIVTIKVLLLYAVIVFNTRAPSTLISVTTSSKSRLKGKLLSYISWRQNTNWLTFLRKHYRVFVSE